MTDTSKDIIYIDIDDEITSIVDKIKSSKHEVVALVLPKRAAMLQSTVNMRLLKRAAKQAKKSIALITSEAGLLPLAGVVGLHVANTLTSKPVIPPIPTVDDQPETIDTDAVEPEVDLHKSVGELAGLPVENDQEEVIEVDNDQPTTGDSEADAATKTVVGAPPKDKKLKIPNFEKFRLKLILIILAIIILIGGWFWAFVVAPKAKVTIRTDTTTLISTLEFMAKTDTQTLDLTTNIVPAQTQSSKKTDTEKVPATGEKNIGEKAKGTMTLKNCTSVDGVVTIPAGTVVGSGSFAFLTNDAVVLPASTFSGGGSCLTATKDVAVTAKESGGAYNLSSRGYSVNGFSGVNATGSAMTGGTDNIVKVVSDSDVEGAKQKIAARAGNVADELRSTLKQSGFIGLSDTLSNDNPDVKADPKVGDQATETTVTVATNYTMIGLKEDDLKRLIEADINKQIDPTKQVMLEAGLKDAVFRVVEKKSPTEVKVSLQTVATVGAKLDQDAIKKQILGKKRGDAESLIANLPGVKEVKVEYSPFWVYSTPKSAKKIIIVVEEVQQKSSNDQQP